MTYKISILKAQSKILEKQLTYGWFQCERSILDLDEIVKEIMFHLILINTCKDLIRI
jgi:hypothetical protein